MRTFSRLGLGSLALATLLAGGAGTAAAASITGVCPDGSMFIVKRAEDIPCPRAKQVDPHEMPPIRPEHLPRPYAWQVFHEKQDPSNPYNLVDQARAVRRGAGPDDESVELSEAAEEPEAQPRQIASAHPVAPALPAPRQLELGLSADERRDLALIVELRQRRAPATLLREANGTTSLVLRLAHSSSFEERLRTAGAAIGRPIVGPVVLFSAEAVAPERFHANLTFSQEHTAFHPERDDPTQFGLLQGGLGTLSAGDIVIGYMVLPATVDPGLPIDVYWNDHRLLTTLRP